MALRNRIPDSRAVYADPIFGVNLNKAQEDLQAGESPKLQNAIFRGGTVTRPGSQRLTSSAVASSLRVRGGHKFYYSTNSSARLIAYGTKVSIISNAGAETVLGAGTEFTNDLDTFFQTWSITDKVYIANGTDELYEYDGTTLQAVHLVGDLDIQSGTYRWTVSASGTNEYYLELNAGGNPSISQPTTVVEGGQAGTEMTQGILGSLAAGAWAYGDNDTLGFSTIYVRVTSGGPDPDTDPTDLWARYSANVPGRSGNAAPRMIFPILDRLMALTENGVERTNARVAHIWSKDSSWATLRPSLVGRFTAGHPVSFRNTEGQPLPGLLAFQANAHYLIRGTDFGEDVTSSSASSGENASIDLLSASVGTSSPYSVTETDIGFFWFTSDLNIYWLPKGQTLGRFVGDKIRSNTTVSGIESAVSANLDQVWCQVFDRFLVLAIPVSGQTYASQQWWMDLQRFIADPNNPVWFGPMTGQTVGRAWVELQNGDNALYGGEGNSSTGVFVYQLMVPNVFKDAVGATDTNVAYEAHTYFKGFGSLGREKYLESLEFDTNTFTGAATVDVLDLTSTIATAIPLEAA